MNKYVRYNCAGGIHTSQVKLELHAALRTSGQGTNRHKRIICTDISYPSFDVAILSV